MTFARAEGIVPAPEAAHAIRVAIDEAIYRQGRRDRSASSPSTSAVTGHFDMGAYDDYFAGRLPDFEYSEAELERALAELPG